MTGRGRLALLPLLGLLLLAAVGCRATGAYPLEVFTEMHYQQSQSIQEPDRLAPPPGAVPINAQPPLPDVSFDDAAQLQPPQGFTPDLARGRQLYLVNCAQCHGVNADGESPVAQRFRAARQAAPPAFASERVRGRAEGQLFWVLTYGYPPAAQGRPATTVNMPAFKGLLTEEERWQLVQYIVSVRGQ